MHGLVPRRSHLHQRTCSFSSHPPGHLESQGVTQTICSDGGHRLWGQGDMAFTDGTGETRGLPGIPAGHLGFPGTGIFPQRAKAGPEELGKHG